MSNLWINIRFGIYHFQMTNEWGFRFSKNNYHVKNPPEKWFEIHEFFGWVQ